MSSTYGENLKLSIFGQSHGPAIGMSMDGIPAGLPVDTDALSAFLTRRAPGHNPWSTPRQESDTPEFLSGLLNGRTCGAPITAVIRNTNTRSADYTQFKDNPRPGHADYTANSKYSGFQDVAGGGHFSGRLTAPLCIAGSLCKQWLLLEGIRIDAHILSIHGIKDTPFSPIDPEIDRILQDFPVLDPMAAEMMLHEIFAAHEQGDSVGGVIECAVTGMPVGLGDPMFGGLESRIASIVYGVPAIKGVEFGAGFGCAELMGSQNNDSFAVRDSVIITKTNNAGGILGGISNGMPMILRCAVKPTPSIAKTQQTVHLPTMEPSDLQIIGRHDPCIVPRAVPVIEAAVAIAVYDSYLGRK